MIYAVDFDGTLCSYKWPDIGIPNKPLIYILAEKRKHGHSVILWTCRVGDKLKEAVDWCKEQGLEFDAINENIPEIRKKFDTDSRKIFANVYIDDRAVAPDDVF